VCRAALGAANLRERLSSLLARGFPVTLPRNVLARELRLPASFARPLALSQQSMRLHTRPAGLRIAPARLWYGALVEVRGLTEAEAESGPTL
jgi:hypothetical protein